MAAASKDLVVEILKAEFRQRSERNQAYSLRAFSRHLGVDASNLSKILSYRLKPGARLKAKLAKRVGLDLAEWDGVASETARPDTRDADYTDHAVDTFKIISDWHHYAMLELIKLKQHQGESDAASMARELNLSLAETEKAIQRMLKAGLLQRDGRGQGLRNAADSSSTILHQASSKAHRDHQRQILELAIDALERTPVDERSQTSMTVAIDRKKLPEAKRLIKNFRRNLARFLSDSSDLDSVYHLSVSLYPVTRNQEPNHKNNKSDKNQKNNNKEKRS